MLRSMKKNKIYETPQFILAKVVLGCVILALIVYLVVSCFGCSCSENTASPHPKVTSTVPAAYAKTVVLNRSITATFSKAMYKPSINAHTFIVKRGIMKVAGKVTYAGITATFTPTSALLPNTVYRVTLTTGMKSASGMRLEKACTWSFTTGPVATLDVTAPTIAANTPLDTATDVALNSIMSITFSEPVQAATITPLTVVVTDSGGGVVKGELLGINSLVTFTPAKNLVQNTVYTVLITPGVKDLAGNAMAAPFTWSFKTSVTPVLDTLAPTVLSTVPLNAAVDVALLSDITITFSEPMDPLTITSVTIELTKDGATVPCLLTYGDETVILDPEESLLPNTFYVVAVALDVKDLAGNTLTTEYSFSFTTLPTPDTTAPTVLLTSPLDGATEVPRNRAITITFSEAMRFETLGATSIAVTGSGTTVVDGEVTSTGTTITFTPLSNLALDTTFVVVLEGATDVAGNALISPYLFSFRTSAALARGPAPVLLGLAGNFAILSKSGVSAIPTTSVTGDIGCSPIDSTAITGFSLSVDASNQFATSSQVVGKLFAADYAEPTPPYLTTAVSDMETAYTDAAGRPIPDYTELGAGEIGGMTLDPGLYKWGTGVSISTDVTLDGGPNDVWIFQVGQGLTMESGVRVTLTGGALAKNVFWQVAGECVIATTARFEGIALCQTAIILRTGATVTGRLLAQTAVTLDQSTVVQSN